MSGQDVVWAYIRLSWGGGLLPGRWPPHWDVLMLQGSDFADSPDNAAKGEVGKKVPAWVQ